MSGEFVAIHLTFALSKLHDLCTTIVYTPLEAQTRCSLKPPLFSCSVLASQLYGTDHQMS